jgi:polyisoprenoid-binding protein YceI
MKGKLLLAALLVMANVVFGQGTWTLDKAHSEILFNVQHLVISEVGGKFKDFDGMVTSEQEDFDGSAIEFKAMVNTISTENEQRDNHLKSDDFFNAEKYPELKFAGTLSKNGSGYVLKGEMTIRDKTNPIEFNVKYNGMVTDPWGNTKAGFKITGSIDRFDYDLKWNTLMEAGGAVVSSEVNIVCNIELQKQT